MKIFLVGENFGLFNLILCNLNLVFQSLKRCSLRIVIILVFLFFGFFLIFLALLKIFLVNFIEGFFFNFLIKGFFFFNLLILIKGFFFFIIFSLAVCFNKCFKRFFNNLFHHFFFLNLILLVKEVLLWCSLNFFFNLLYLFK